MKNSKLTNSVEMTRKHLPFLLAYCFFSLFLATQLARGGSLGPSWPGQELVSRHLL